VTSIASFQSAEALKILANRREALRNTVLHVDLWDGTLAQIKTGEPKPQCPACQLDQWEYLAGQHHAATASICGRNTVQILPSKVQAIDLARIALQLQSYGTVTSNAFLLRCKLTKHTLTLFADGRALIEGTSDPAEARSLYARLLG
jgi:adenylyltransferase/sulfurtransferase